MGAFLGFAGSGVLGLLEAMGVALELHDFGAVDQTVDERDDRRGGGKDLVPLGKRLVGGDEDGLRVVAAGDKL
jgi:hypothetical protein